MHNDDLANAYREQPVRVVYRSQLDTEPDFDVPDLSLDSDEEDTAVY